MELSPREKAHLELLYPYLAECTLFLKRDHHFPLKSPCCIAAYGRGVRHTIKGGTGSGDVYARFFTTIEDGLEEAGFKLVSKSWLKEADEIFDAKRKDWVKIVKKEAKNLKMLAPMYVFGKPRPEIDYDLKLNLEAEAAIYVVSRVSGEGSDRAIEKGDILLTDQEIRDIKLLNSKYEKFMLVINAGGVVDLSEVMEVRNILVLSELGTETGRVLADILLGKVNPSGKLTATWAKIDDYPYDKNIPIDNTYYNDGKYVGYRYFDSFNVEPLFAFGYGLSYTSFKLDNYSFSHNGKIVKISLDVTNNGHYKGKEVVQAYVSYLGEEESPYQELVSYKKTSEIEPEKKENITLTLDLTHIAKYDLDRELYYLAKGEYLIRVGNASNNTEPVLIIELLDDIIIKEAHNIFGHIEVEELKSSFIKEKPSKIHKISLNQMDFPITHNDEKELFVPEEISKLSLDELIHMNIGYVNEQRSLSIFGESSKIAPGAAGEASSAFAKHFNNHIVMADGPAGIRLMKRYYKKGDKIVPIDHNVFLVDTIEFFPWPIRWIIKKLFMKKVKIDKNDKIYYQYCTALPIATAIAQSFNNDFAYLCGDIVGKEMEEFNIDLWLAPAMNIQRTIMCGRNFEYYSEDPYLTGMMASSITRGVESHPGKGVVIKHFAANNQETFRFVSNSVMNEKTLREIYLRGFEICINETQPKGIMSSYNLINYENTSENNRLLEGYLYKENRYQGIIMTDWIMKGSKPALAKYDISRVEKVYKASTSLFMPGSKYDIKQLRKELAKHPENRILLEKNATRLYKNFAK